MQIQKRFVPAAGLCFFLAAMAHVEKAVADELYQTHYISEGRIDTVATALGQISSIELPENVTNAAIGSDRIQMEFNGNTVLLEPHEPGVETDLMVWTEHTRTLYRIKPAVHGEPGAFFLREAFTPPPPPPPGPSPLEAQLLRDRAATPLLLSVHPISAPHFHVDAPKVSLRVEYVAQDAYSYYVRLRVYNRTDHQYRVSTPAVYHLSPLFGAKMALTSVDEQLTQRKFNKVYSYDADQLPTHGSTLDVQDVQPGGTVEWDMAVTKPEHSPAMYQFVMPKDGEAAVSAVVVF